MNHQHVVSILVPIYNAETYLSQCIESILGQTYANLQVILIDDGSIDNSYAICKEYVKLDTRVELYHQENQGVAITRNNLLEKVRGDYVLFIDADDWVESDMVESLVDLAETHNADIVTCKNVINDSVCQKDSIKLDTWSQEETIYHFLCHIILNGSLWNKLIRTRLLNGIKFQPDISFGEDALFCWQVLQCTQKVVQTSAQYYHYRMNNDSISHQRFGEKRMSGHIVWEQISRDAEKNWPQYSEIANVSFAISDMWQLYYAAEDGYKYDDFIKECQLHVRKNLLVIAKSKLVNFKKYVFAVIVSINYRVARLLVRIFK